MERITTGPDRNRPHFVYELWTDTQCLYVGMSSALGSRIRRHSEEPWWPRVRRIESNWYPDKDQARDRETELIRRYDPTYNFYHSTTAEGCRTGRGSGGVAFRRADVL